MGKSASKQFAEEVLKVHNDYRKKHGVPPLKLCKKLNRGAQQYAEELATTRVLKHSSESANGNCGENLAWASYDQSVLQELLRGRLFFVCVQEAEGKPWMWEFCLGWLLWLRRTCPVADGNTAAYELCGGFVREIRGQLSPKSVMGGIWVS
ncbi:Golgi-associated plant pathogenesis-related protein 1 isoform X2 [Hirundo rustica]|uniref:Golgi-associated plant pathogenesis-related protein 1 isoform X2 n=1 Tax=Hirundo rustica TaxID=43150 RepID=UPI001A93C31A|nr:Golgi-associated plant pathogenesis-related protein 1 isoform X2 [Hirundo rustica]